MSVRYQVSGMVAVIEMDDGKANALDHAKLEALEDAFDEIEQDRTARAVVLAGRPGLFCGGFDLTVIKGGTPEEAMALFRRGGLLLDRLIAYPKPLVVAATGHAVAMGAFLALCADYRVGAAGDHKFGLNESAVGIDIPYMGVQIAQERMPPSYLTRTVVLGELFDPETAVAAGLLDEVAPAERTLEQAREIAGRLTALVPSAVAANKRSLRRNLLRRIKAEE